MIWKLKCINDEYNNVDILPIYSLSNKSCPEFYGDHTLFQPFCQKKLLEKVNPLSIWTLFSIFRSGFFWEFQSSVSEDEPWFGKLEVQSS